jgi:hypothetical protein
MMPSGPVCALAVAVLIPFSAEGGEGRHTTCLEKLSLRVTHPSRWTVRELEGGWYFAEYEVSDTQAEGGYAVSIVLTAHTASSIEKSVAQCMDSNSRPEASGDTLCIPTLTTYETRRQLLRQKATRGGPTVRTFGGRRFVVDEVHGEGLHLRTYSTFFGELMIEVTFNYGMPPGPDPRKADEFLSQLSFEKGACRRTPIRPPLVK